MTSLDARLPHTLAVVENDHLVFATVRISPGGAWTSAPPGWRFLLVRRGRGDWVSPLTRQPLAAGDVLVLHNGAHCTLEARPPKELEACHFRFAPDQLVGLLTFAERQALDSVANQHDAGRLFRADTAFARQFQHLSQEPAVPGTLAHRCLVLQVVATLLNHVPNRNHGGGPNPNAQIRVREVVAHLTESQLQTLSVEELAKKCGCGRRHLNRLLREQFGCSFLSLKMELRLEKAAALLKGTDDKTINIALECGFNHLGLFSARFKRRFGASPSEWRRQELGSKAHSVGADTPAGPLHPTIRLEWSEPKRSGQAQARGASG